MKILITVVLEPHDAGAGGGGGSQVTLEVTQRQVPGRHKWSTVDEAHWAGAALNGVVRDARSWIDARRRGAR